MTHEITTGTILIKDDAVLPEELQLESEPCVPGWRLVKNFDACGLDRGIQKTGWTFFCLAGEIKATVFGIDRQKMVRRAIERILASPKLEELNSLEITRVASVGSERFPLVRYVTVSARLRHIHSGKLVSLPRQRSSKAGGEKSEPSSQSTGIAGDRTSLSQEPTQGSTSCRSHRELVDCICRVNTQPVTPAPTERAQQAVSLEGRYRSYSRQIFNWRIASSVARSASARCPPKSCAA